MQEFKTRLLEDLGSIQGTVKCQQKNTDPIP